jgi:hypothetical protein
MKMIKLTNAAEEYKGLPILINPKFIVSVFEVMTEKDENAVFVFSSTNNSWQVEESLDEISDMIGLNDVE